MDQLIWQVFYDHILSCLENHFRKNKEVVSGGGGGGGGGQLVPIGSSMTCRKVSPNFTKMLSIKNPITLHISFALHVLSPPESIELLKYPLLPSTLVYVYLLLPSFYLKEFVF